MLKLLVVLVWPVGIAAILAVTALAAMRSARRSPVATAAMPARRAGGARGTAHRQADLCLDDQPPAALLEVGHEPRDQGRRYLDHLGRGGDRGGLPGGVLPQPQVASAGGARRGHRLRSLPDPSAAAHLPPSR